MMSRRTLLLAAPQALAQPEDPYRELAAVWNPFAKKLNDGVLDLRLWKRVVHEVNRIEGQTCK